MHRMPLHLLEPSISWDRNLPECVLFEKTLTKGNVGEMHTFIDLLDEQCIFFETHINPLTDKWLQEVHSIIGQHGIESFRVALRLLNTVVLKAPSDSKTLAWALKLRADLNFDNGQYRLAGSDYEMVLRTDSVKQPLRSDELCVLYGRLTVCSFMMHSLKVAKIFFQHYEHFHGTLNDEQLKTVEYVEKDVELYKNECLDCDYMSPSFLEYVSFRVPYKGFSTSSEIHSASAACSYRNDGVYANAPIPRGGVVFVEASMLQTFSIPRLFCDICFTQCINNPNSCFKCRYKVYCSISCMNLDKRHNSECLGYRQLTLILLGATHIYSMFVSIMNVLRDNVLNRYSFRKCKTADVVLKKLFDLINSSGFCPEASVLKIIKTRPKYENLLPQQFSTVVATAFRVTMFVEKKTDTFQVHLNKLSLSDKQKLIFVGTILMRIHANFLLNSFDVECTYETEYKTSYGENWRSDIKPVDCIQAPNMVNSDIWQYYNIDDDRDVVLRLKHILKKASKLCFEKLPVVLHTRPCEQIRCWMSVFRDAVAQKCLRLTNTSQYDIDPVTTDPQFIFPQVICNKIARMNDEERLLYVSQTTKYFHLNYERFFHEVLRRNPHIKQVATVYCPVMRKFRHSCQPNVEIIALENGMIIGKALRTIRENEELFVAYKARYTSSRQCERKAFLEEIKITCQCKSCLMTEEEERTSKREGIFCHNDTCGDSLIVPADKRCPDCGEPYEKLLIKYRITLTGLIDELETTIYDAEYPHKERDIFITNMILYMKTQSLFGPQNETRIHIELHFIQYLAKKNFVFQAYTLILDLRNNILVAYPEDLIWFSFYNVLVNTISEMLSMNLNGKLMVASADLLLELCDLGLYIIRGQIGYLRFQERFDCDSILVLPNLATFLRFRDLIFINCPELTKMTPSNTEWSGAIVSSTVP